MNNYFKIYIVYLGERRHEDPELVTESHHDMLASVLGRYVVVRMYHVLHVPRTTHMLAMLLCPAFFIYNIHIQNLHARKYTSLESAAALINHFFGFLSKEDALSSIVYSYKHGFSGFAARMTESQARKIRGMPGVVSVRENQIRRVHTTRSWDFLGLDYKQPNGLLAKSSFGDGIIIGVLDSGNQLGCLTIINYCKHLINHSNDDSCVKKDILAPSTHISTCRAFYTDINNIIH